MSVMAVELPRYSQLSFVANTVVPGPVYHPTLAPLHLRGAAGPTARSSQVNRSGGEDDILDRFLRASGGLRGVAGPQAGQQREAIRKQLAQEKEDLQLCFVNEIASDEDVLDDRDIDMSKAGEEIARSNISQKAGQIIVPIYSPTSPSVVCLGDRGGLRGPPLPPSNTNLERRRRDNRHKHHRYSSPFPSSSSDATISSQESSGGASSSGKLSARGGRCSLLLRSSSSSSSSSCSSAASSRSASPTSGKTSEHEHRNGASLTAQSPAAATETTAAETEDPELMQFRRRVGELQEQARQGLTNAKETAREELEADKQRAAQQEEGRPQSPASAILSRIGIMSVGGRLRTGGAGRSVAGSRLTRSKLSGLSVGQLQLILNHILAQIEQLNEELVLELMNRDERSTKQDGLLTDIDDLSQFINCKL